VSTRFSLADRLAVMALVLAGVAAATGLLVSGLYRDTAEMVRQARAADLVTLAAAVPALGLGLWRARSGSAKARLIAIGALGYLSYSYAIYAFSVVINPLTPVHIAILGLAAWSFVLGIFALDRATVDRSSRITLPRRTAGGFLIVVAVLFALLWLGQIAGAITSGKLPASITDLNLPTNAVYALDLAFALPLLAVAGGWLIRHDRRGPAAALAALGFVVLMGLSVLAIFAVDAAASISIELVPVVIFGMVTGIAAVLAALALITSPRASA
jgi:cytochrome d ubiquinol oxidase subunit II